MRRELDPQEPGGDSKGKPRHVLTPIYFIRRTFCRWKRTAANNNSHQGSNWEIAISEVKNYRVKGHGLQETATTRLNSATVRWLGRTTARTSLPEVAHSLHEKLIP